MTAGGPPTAAQTGKHVAGPPDQQVDSLEKGFASSWLCPSPSPGDGLLDEVLFGDRRPRSSESGGTGLATACMASPPGEDAEGADVVKVDHQDADNDAAGGAATSTKGWASAAP